MDVHEAWRELMFADTEQEAKLPRDPVAPAKRSDSAQRKAQTKVLDDGQSAHSFATLMLEMATLARNTCRTPGADTGTATGKDIGAAITPSFDITTRANATQQKALDLIKAIQL